MHSDGLHLSLGNFALRDEPYHKFRCRIVVQSLILREIHLSAVRTLPQKEISVLHSVLEFRIVSYVDAFVDYYLVLLPAFAARRKCFIDD